MNFPRTRHAQDSDNAILPLTNIVFLLLIFFLLAGRLATPEPFNIEPPDSASAAAAGASALKVQMSANGDLALDGEPIELEQLKTAVQARLDSRSAPLVQLKADGDTQASRVVSVMHVLSEAGADKLRLLTLRAAR